MIDTDGYRMNVGIILINQDGHVLWAKRVGQDAWQFPQGGIKAHETPKRALFRELYEELGLTIKQVHVLGATHGWLRYRLPHHLIRHYQRPLCIGQKQVWYMLRLLSNDNSIYLEAANPEFDQWLWVDYWYPLTEVIYFKKEVYENALNELQPLVQRIKTEKKRRLTYKLPLSHAMI
ncbi:RNA pyrophosphohydrolase [Candidatus Marithioploca araucensis]|uniref:RNA pyrophosphohydrolase n=1 Tax=Candidatus Marithioploca araucensis TaxID=70273 RepID=A0ABT7VRT5_9GAMM|nr:RNA pyrophosphohydrolase [Thiotrichales bacterium HSG14]MDM8562385.1 RNA pyrophosphohydrolase [Candidatus Marithioploca araucensis]